MAKFSSNKTTTLESLSAEIGDNIYLEIAKWHLYLSNARLHSVLAERVFPLIENDRLTAEAVETILRDIPVTIGGEKQELPIWNFLPQSGFQRLMNLLEDFQKNLYY